MKTKEEILKKHLIIALEAKLNTSKDREQAIYKAMDEYAADNIKSAMDVVYGWLSPDAITVEQDFVECDDLDKLKETFIIKRISPNVE